MNIGPIFTKFTFGECSPLLWSRVDLSKYPAGCKKLTNFIPLLQGPVTRRGGTRYVSTAANGGNPVVLIRFVKDDDDIFVIELGNKYARFYSNGKPVLSSSGAVYQIWTPWTQAALFDKIGISKIKYVQSNDVIFVVTPDIAPMRLNHYGLNNWTVTTLDGWGTRPNAQAITIWRERLCLASGNTLYMSQSGAFANFEVAKRIVPGARITYTKSNIMTGPSISNTSGEVRFYNNRGWSVTIGFNVQEASAAVVSGEVRITPKNAEKGLTKLGIIYGGQYYNPQLETQDAVWDVRANVLSGSISGYTYTDNQSPTSYGVTLFCDSQKVSFYVDNVSTTSDGYSHGYIIRGEENAVAADDPIEISIYSDTSDDIVWLVPSAALLIGTGSAELTVSETAASEPFGPENIKIAPQTSFGSAPIEPLRVGSVVVFVQRAGRKVREFVYDYAGDSFLALDLTVAAEHITKGGLTCLAWQSEPSETLWATRPDGQLIGFTYSKDQDMTAWHRHILGGGQANQVVVVPTEYGGHDELWLSVKRVINGKTVYYIERMDPGFTHEDAVEDAFFVDCGVTVTGNAMTRVAGLSHLEGQTVAILADGGVQPEQVVTGGAVPLKYAANKAQVGLPYTSYLTTVNLELALQDGTLQGRIKRIISTRLRLIDSLGGAAGHDLDNLEALEFRRPDYRMDQAVPLLTGDSKVSWPHGYETEGQLTVAQKYPLPFTLAAIIAEVSVEGRDR